MPKVNIYPPRFCHCGLRGTEGRTGLGISDNWKGTKYSDEENRIRIYWARGSVATEYVNFLLLLGGMKFSPISTFLL